jgi:proteasome lid subunit RPN8/RPN11
LGHAFREGDETVVEVKAALPALSNDHGPVHFTFNADAWSQVHRDRTSRHPQLDIVGWFHTHPGLGVFYSADDVIVHSAAFVMPWHVGLVIDPLREEAAFFGWSNDTIAPLKGFYEVADEAGQSSVPWQAVESAVWDETYEEHLLRQQQSEVGGIASTELPPVSPWLGILAGVLGIVLTLGLLFGGVLPLYLHSTNLENIVVSLADNNLEAASGAGLAECPDPALRIYAPAPGSAVASGTILAVSGVAQHEGAASYAIEIRPGEELEWWPIHSFNRDVELGRLVEWDTTGYAPARYQMRLVALNDQQQPLAGATPCNITFDLTAADASPQP